MRAAAVCELLPWDSDWFGVRIARVRGHRLTPARVQTILRWCRRQHIACLYFLAGSDDAGTIRLAEQAGFRCVDVRMTFERELRAGSGARRATGGITVRPARPADLPGLRRIARTSHRDTRFFADPGFARPRAAGLYERWIERSYQGAASSVLVAARRGRPLGYLTLRRDAGDVGRIELVGVEAAVRGQGIGSLLVQAGLAWCRRQRLERVRVVTQERNLSAQRLYQRHGFLAHEVRLSYHKWFTPLSASPKRMEAPVEVAVSGGTAPALAGVGT